MGSHQVAPSHLSLPKVHIININLLQYSLHTPSPTHTLQAILRQVLKSQPTGIQSLSLPPRFQDSQIDRRPARLHTPLSIDSITSSGPSVHSCISIYMTRAPTSYPPPPSSTLNFFSPPTMLVLHPHHPHYNIGNEQQPPFYQAGLPHLSLPKVHIININLLQYSLHTPSPTHTLQAILRQVLN